MNRNNVTFHKVPSESTRYNQVIPAKTTMEKSSSNSSSNNDEFEVIQPQRSHSVIINNKQSGYNYKHLSITGLD